jgi:hypothetical protein
MSVQLYFAATSNDRVELLREMKIDKVMASFAHFKGKPLPFKNVIMDSGAFTDYGQTKKKLSAKHPYLEHLANCTCKNVVHHVMLDVIGKQKLTCCNFAEHVAKGHKCSFVYYAGQSQCKDVCGCAAASIKRTGWTNFAGTGQRYRSENKISVEQVLKSMEEHRKKFSKGNIHLLGSFRTQFLTKFLVNSADVSSFTSVQGFGKFLLFTTSKEKGMIVSALPFPGSRLLESASPRVKALVAAAQREAKKIGLDLRNYKDQFKWNIRQFKLYEKALARLGAKREGTVEKIDPDYFLKNDLPLIFWEEKKQVVVQSVILSKTKFKSLAQARAWVKSHGFKTSHKGKGPDETDTSYRFRQRDPGDFARMRTKQLTEGVSAVVGPLKEGKVAKVLCELDPAGDEAMLEIDGSVFKISTAQVEVPLVEAEEEEDERELTVEFLPVEKKDKAPDDRQIVFGEVLVPDETDAHKDFATADDIERAAHLWLARFQDRGVMHNRIVNSKIEIYESYIARTNLTIGGRKVKKGTWLLMVHILDSDLWAKVKKGEFTGFSMGGFARRTKV